MNEEEGAFYIKERLTGHYDILIDESDGQGVIVFANFTEEQAHKFCSRLNKAVARYVATNRDRIGGQDE